MTIRIDGANTAANPGITGTDTDTGLQFGTDEINIVTGGSTAVTVDSSQRVGINTSSPSAFLHVQNGEIVKDQDSSQNSANPGFQIKHNGTINGSWRHDGRLEIGGQDANADVRLDTEGIKFNGDTAAANALDDYEEGSWTPEFQYYSGGSWFGVSYTSGPSNTTGKYVKIGNVVHFSYYTGSFDINSGAAATARIGGLPYSAYNDSGSYSGAIFYHTNCFSTVINSGFVNIGDTQIYPIKEDSTDGPNWNGNSNTYLMVSGTYRTT